MISTTIISTDSLMIKSAVAAKAGVRDRGGEGGGGCRPDTERVKRTREEKWKESATTNKNGFFNKV